MGAATLVHVVPFTLRPPPSDAATAAAPTPDPTAESGGFWESASTGEKVAIVGGGIGALLLLYLAFKK